MSPCFIVTRCGSHQKKPYIVRFRQREAGWVFENATAIPETKVGGGDVVNLEGQFLEGPQYPGCPHCKSRSFFLCTCGKLNCWDGRMQQVTCAWCAITARIGGQIQRISGRSG